MSCVNCIARHTFHKALHLQSTILVLLLYRRVCGGGDEMSRHCFAQGGGGVFSASAPLTRNPSKYSSGRNSVVECSICPWHNVIPQSSHSENLEIL